mgnify:CR=1 FL=1
MAKNVAVAKMPSSDYVKNARVLGKLIKAKRTALGLKLVDCAALCGIGINTLSRIVSSNEDEWV